jgi:hypothetical protein
MTARRFLFALTVVGGSLVFGSATALAAPKVPSGCTFDQGVQTCISSTTTVSQLPETTNSQFISASTMFDGISGSQICGAVFVGAAGGAPATRIEMDGSTFLDVSITVTTTTQRHGMNGPVFATSTSSTSSLSQVVPGNMGCAF